jgi:integrase
LALAILTYMPIRLQNLVALAFDVDVFLMAGAGATSTLELPGVKVKNNQPIAFDIPPHIVRMLNSYRDDFAPSVLGHRPVHVFVNMDGSRKGDKALRYLIQTYMKRYVGVDFNPHTFRHLGAAVILKAHPGGHSIVKDLLGHKSLNTSIKHYIGIRTREAGLHMQRLLDDPAPTVARRRPRRPDRDRRRGGKR